MTFAMPNEPHDLRSPAAYEATDWRPLVRQLANDIRQLRGADPLRPVTLVVSSVGMKIWLTRRLADEHGVAANIRAAYPRQLMGEIAAACGVAPVDYAAFSQEQLAWRLHRALGDAAVVRGTPLEAYLANDADGVKRVRLALRLADTFDRYLAYRPEMMRQWDRAPASTPEDAVWQSNLWRAATHALPSPHRHFPELLATLTPERLASADAAKLPAAVFLIGIAGMPPAYVEVFKRLGSRLPVRVYQNIPSSDFLNDMPTTAEARARHLLEWETADWKHHPLLMTCGKVARTLRCRFLDDFENAETLPAVESPAASQLARLQESLRDNAGDAGLGEPDGSIVVDACHGPMREVEVLRDRLLAALDEIPGLRPRDILVLSPALTEYSAYIRAVFGSGSADDPRFLPFSVADKAVADARPAYALASGLLTLPRSRMGAAEVAALLESPVTAARMHWDARDLELVRIRLEQARVSWGADLKHRESVAPGASPYGTWHDFLSRLRLGFALAADDSRLFDATAPLTGIETGQTETLGGLAERIERLIVWHADSHTPRTVDEWCKRFRDEINAWLPEDDDEFAEQAKTLRRMLDRLAHAAQAAGYAETLPYAAFAEFVRPELAITEDGGRFLTEGITFAALKPLRSVPARVIALLGVNAQNFPRKNRPDGFDLMAKAPRPGDPDKTAEDRGLFLDCLLAARDRLLIVTTGRSAVDDEPLPLSPVVEELLGVIKPAGGKAHERVVVQPPFPYSLHYHDNKNAALFTFDRNATQAAAARVTEAPGAPFSLFPGAAIPPVPADFAAMPPSRTTETVPWRNFLEYFRDFPKFLLRSQLNLDLRLEADEWPTDELPEESEAALDRYRLTDALIRNGAAAAFDHAAASGLASPSGPGRAQFETAAKQAESLLSSRRQLEAETPLPLAFPIGFGALTLRYEGRFTTNATLTRFVTLRAGDLNEKARVQAELDALALALRPERKVVNPEELVVLHTGNKGGAGTFPIPSPDEARTKLERLVADFLRHRETPYPFSLKARTKLREANANDLPDGEELAEMMRPGFGKSDPFMEALWTDALLSEIEGWDEAQIRRRAEYERFVWSL